MAAQPPRIIPEDEPFVMRTRYREAMNARLAGLRRRVPDWAWDTALVALAVLLLVLELRSFSTFGSFLRPDGVSVLLQVILMSGLLLRRRWPFAMALLVLATSYTYQALDYVPLATIELATLVAVFSAAAHGRQVPRAVPLVIIALWLVATDVASPAPFEVSSAVIRYVILVGAWMLGERERAHRAYSAMLEERNALLEHEREIEVAQVAATERTRIARELHDVIAHGLGVVVVQSEAALYSPEGTAPDVRGPLEAIRSAARASLAETRRILGMLRADRAALPRQPQHGVEDLPSLIEDFTAAGLDIDVQLPADLPPLEPGVGLSIYCIVEEALTNTLRHAHAARAWVTLKVSSGAIHLEVVDNGSGAASPDGTQPLASRRPEPAEGRTVPRPPGPVPAVSRNGHALDAERTSAAVRPEPVEGRAASRPPASAYATNGHIGHGLIGMRERVAMLHGMLEAGPRPGGGFAVRVTLPLDPTPVAAAGSPSASSSPTRRSSARASPPSLPAPPTSRSSPKQRTARQPSALHWNTVRTSCSWTSACPSSTASRPPASCAPAPRTPTPASSSSRPTATTSTSSSHCAPARAGSF
jgi:signal transduction histidine kinase